MAKIRIGDGDIQSSDADIIVQQVNCLGTSEPGIALAKDRRQRTHKTYKAFCKKHRKNAEDALLGQALIVPFDKKRRFVAYCFGLMNMGTGVRTNYDAMGAALRAVARHADQTGSKTVVIPHGLGCGEYGGNWTYILDEINKAFAQYDGVVEIRRAKQAR